MKIRVRDLQKGDIFQHLNYEYKVYKILDTEIKYFPCSSSSKSNRLSFGRKSMQFVMLIKRK
jgi:hypothetical protein